MFNSIECGIPVDFYAFEVDFCSKLQMKIILFIGCAHKNMHIYVDDSAVISVINVWLDKGISIQFIINRIENQTKLSVHIVTKIIEQWPEIEREREYGLIIWPDIFAQWNLAVRWGNDGIII